MDVSAAEMLALRQLVLSVCVLDDVDLQPTTEGVLLPGSDAPRDVVVPWSALLGCLDHPGLARFRAAGLLRATRQLVDADPAALATLVRPVGWFSRAPDHPGIGWVKRRVLGGALDLGLGMCGLTGDPDRVDVLPDGAAAAAGLDDAAWDALAEEYLERMGALTAQRLVADSSGVLRPMGDCDALTLLGSRTLREALASEAGGMRAVAVPMRRRGWTDVRRIDPAFAAAAALATEPHERGFPRLVLVTADEVALAADHGAGRDADPVGTDEWWSRPRRWS